MYDVVLKRSRSLSHLLMSSCIVNATAEESYFVSARRSGTVFWIVSGTWRSMQTVSYDYSKRICLLYTSASS